MIQIYHYTLSLEVKYLNSFLPFLPTQTSIRASTLIILPTIALRQWQMEVSRFTREGVLSVKVRRDRPWTVTWNFLDSKIITLDSATETLIYLTLQNKAQSSPHSHTLISSCHIYLFSPLPQIYHGTNRSTTLKDLKAVDIVLTSYAVRSHCIVMAFLSYKRLCTI